MIAEKIISIAQKYLGKEEIQPNKGFKNLAMDHEMRTMTPYVNGAAWCASLMILIWKKAYVGYPKMLAWLDKLFSANSQQMARNFHNDSQWPTGTTIPVLGAAAIFGDVGSTISGHTACAIISISKDGTHYTTIEGNTRPDGNPGNVAEGYIVATHTHKVGEPHPVTGLAFIRFIYPVEPNTLIKE